MLQQIRDAPLKKSVDSDQCYETEQALRSILIDNDIPMDPANYERKFVDATDNAQDICVEIVGRSLEVQSYCQAFLTDYSTLYENIEKFCTHDTLTINC